MPGPAPKPTALKSAEGNRAHRPLPVREPTPLTGEPQMPRHLDALAKREWRRLTPILLSLKILSEADGLALANLCMTYSTLVQAQRLMLKATKGSASPLLMKTPSGCMAIAAAGMRSTSQIGCCTSDAGVWHESGIAHPRADPNGRWRHRPAGTVVVRRSLKGEDSMENETPKLETPEEFREAVSVLARELVSLRELQVATAQLVQAIDPRIRALTALVDHHHKLLTKIAGLPPRPKEDPLVN